jgi:hypothetical protein
MRRNRARTAKALSSPRPAGAVNVEEFKLPTDHDALTPKALAITVSFSGAPVELPWAAPKKVWRVGNACIDHVLNAGLFMPSIESRELPTIRADWRRQLAAAVGAPPGIVDLLGLEMQASRHQLYAA